MVIRFVHGKHVVCQHYMAISEIIIGSEWLSHAGAIVIVDNVDHDGYLIYYHEVNNEKQYMKDSVSFQSRYSKIV
jgi:hypothetical protein